MSRKKVVTAINILLSCAMAIHVGVSMYLHAQHPEYSAPYYTEIINAVYYLIALLVVNLVNVVLKKKQA
jgi:hypothetical protein